MRGRRRDGCDVLGFADFEVDTFLACFGNFRGSVAGNLNRGSFEDNLDYTPWCPSTETLDTKRQNP